jgi:hypothetical protein
MGVFHVCCPSVHTSRKPSPSVLIFERRRAFFRTIPPLRSKRETEGSYYQCPPSVSIFEWRRAPHNPSLTLNVRWKVPIAQRPPSISVFTLWRIFSCPHLAPRLPPSKCEMEGSRCKCPPSVSVFERRRVSPCPHHPSLSRNAKRRVPSVSVFKRRRVFHATRVLSDGGRGPLPPSLKT